MTRTVWTPEIRAAMNVHHNVHAADGEDMVTSIEADPKQKNALGICWDVNGRLTILSRQNHWLVVGPRIEWAKMVLRIVF
jgi:hypothetical protein